MATRSFAMRPSSQPDMDSQPVVVPEPETLDDPSPSIQWQRLAPIFMIVIMVAFFALMISSGARNIASSPYMLMPFMGMAMMAFAYLGVGGQGGGALGDLAKKRKNYWLQLRERRKIAHHHGRQLHDLQATLYPNPASLLSKIDTAEMWTVRPNSGAPTAGAAADEIPESLQPWLTARLGVGVARLVPGLKYKDELAVDEQREPVTFAAYRRFLRTQSFVTNCPKGISFAEHPAYSFRGDPDAVLAAARAMAVSLAFNHGPTHLAIGLITDTAGQDSWDWLKWLPHTQNRFRTDRGGTARLVWRSLSDFAADPIVGNPDNKAHLIVFIDTPDADAALPPDLEAPNTTFIVLRALSETLSTVASRFHISADHWFSTPTQERHVRSDALTPLQARLIAQKMSDLRPGDWELGTTAPTDVDAERKSFFDALNITDLETWDPRPGWDKHEWDSHFYFPLGFQGTPDEPTNTVVHLDLGESSVGGAGPHGVSQGMTGSGKSFMLRAMVLAACAKYSPSKLKLALLDFKGGTTFQGFDALPHVIANISNLTDQAETVDRMVEILEGEIERRETLINEFKVDGIVEYRQKRAADPDKYPPLPELVILIDEFREYMDQHKDQGHLKLLTRTGTVGRALGMHVWACSQFIDATQIQELSEHISFGISLRTRDGARSRTVLKVTDAAKDLPPGKGAALLHTDIDDALTPFVGFNSKELYVPPRLRTQLAGGPAGTAAGLGRLHSFTLANGAADPSGPAADDPSTAETPQAPIPGLPSMADALIERLSTFDADRDLLDLWKPSLRAPISYHEIDIAPAATARLEIRIGDLDAPRLSRRLPYVLHPEGGKAHIRIIGKGGSGRTTAVEAIVAGAARAYSPAFASFYLVDYAGAKLSEIKDLPNVGGYASKTDADRVARLVGETFRLLDVREREFAARGVATLDQYFASRLNTPLEDDPYGHFFLVIDGFPSYTEDFPEAKETFLRLATDAGRYGIHLVVTADSVNRLPMKMIDYFATVIQLPIEDPATAMGLNATTRPLVKAIPADQPGRCVDLQTGLSARIVVPQYGKIEPIDYRKGMPIYAAADYSAGIAAFVASMQQMYRTPDGEPITAPAVDPAPPVIDYSVVWEVANRGRVLRAAHSLGHQPTAEEFTQWWATRPAQEKRLPIGVSAEDLRIVELPEDPCPHLLALGSPRSGRTSLLRGAINSVVNQYSPDQAQLVIIESKYELLTEQEELAKRGYLMAYSGDRTTLAEAIEKVAATINPRAPRMDQQLTAETIRNRSWWSGPEVFVIIDDIQMVAGSGFQMNNPLDPLYGLLEGRTDLGLHVLVTGPAQGFGSTRMSNRGFKALEAAQATVLLFSGPVAEGVLWPGSGIKFASRRPGQAHMITLTTMAAEVIQTAHARPWDQ